MTIVVSDSVAILPDLSDAIGLGLLLLDERGAVQQCNRWMIRHAGFAVPPLGQNFRLIFSGPIDVFLLDAIQMAIEKRMASRLSHALHPSPLPLFSPPRQDSERISQAIDVLPITGPQSGRWCLVQVRDVSEMVNRERLLRQLTRQLSLDVAELKQSRDALRQRSEDAEAADRTKSVFLSVVTHELRSPLHTILGYAELLRREPVGETALAQIDTLEHSGRQLMRIIDDILQFSRGHESGNNLCPRPFPVREFVSQLERTISLQLKNARCFLEIHLSPELPDVIEADEQRLVQVIGNLIDNACKYAPGGSIRLEIAPLSAPMAPSSPPASATPRQITLEIRVEDEGPGIPVQDMERIFDPFHRLPNSRYQRGLGLGLSIARRIVAQMEGSITAANRPAGGCVFCVSITVSGFVTEDGGRPSALPPQLPRSVPKARRDGSSALPRDLRRRLRDLLAEGRISRLEELAGASIHRHPTAQAELEELQRYCRLADLSTLGKLLAPRRRLPKKPVLRDNGQSQAATNRATPTKP